ncbi:hypothetical protein [Silanimonas sp.]|jgi:hypothetical protein|uniref:hypothetical protein n=1 Tax=Silanimonas sp. TaxID=1929290 RepID=UPI0022C81BC9|nr:hypothetical protein [Silanimonas sp.]MCZ8114811.1 hypothetical protein [Silanimonas sp.]
MKLINQAELHSVSAGTVNQISTAVSIGTMLVRAGASAIANAVSKEIDAASEQCVIINSNSITGC